MRPSRIFIVLPLLALALSARAEDPGAAPGTSAWYLGSSPRGP